MYKVFESAMNGTFDLSQMLDRINHHHVLGNLSNDERDRLVSLAQSRANPFAGVDVMAKIREMDERIAALEKARETEGPAGTDAPEEYVPGKWYRNGDRIIWKAKVYICANVPDGHVCTWNPDEYPAYWVAE